MTARAFSLRRFSSMMRALPHSTLIEVITEDRPGLLYRITALLSLTIRIAILISR